MKALCKEPSEWLLMMIEGATPNFSQWNGAEQQLHAMVDSPDEGEGEVPPPVARGCSSECWLVEPRASRFERVCVWLHGCLLHHR